MRWSRALLVMLVLLVLAFVYGAFILRTDSPQVVDLSTVVDLANEGKIEAIEVEQNE